MSLAEIVKNNLPPETAGTTVGKTVDSTVSPALPACPASIHSHRKFWVDALARPHCWDCESPAALSLIRSYYSLDPVTWDVTPPPPAIRAAALAEMAKTDPVGALASQEALDPAWMTWLDEATGRRVLCHCGREREAREALRWKWGKEAQP
jgi:hypothetical protein